MLNLKKTVVALYVPEKYTDREQCWLLAFISCQAHVEIVYSLLVS